MRIATLVFAIGAATGFKDAVHVASPATLMSSIGAPPEALIIGGGLLMLASLLRRGLATQSK
jgi:hypothetical protein